MFRIKKLFKSFRHAFSGLFQVLQEEQSFRIQLAATTVVIFLMLYFKLDLLEKVVLVLVIIGVLILELMNTIFERLSDILKPRIHSYIREIKDIMAAAVLVASIGAIIVGLLIFWKYIFK